MAYYFLNAQSETIKKLQNEIESLQVERDFFRDNYENQIKIIQTLEKELKKSNNVTSRLRKQLVQNITPIKANNSSIISHKIVGSSLDMIGASFDGADCNLGDREGEDDNQSVTKESLDTDSETISSYDTDVTDDEITDVRDHAAKMLIWADYSCANPDNSSSNSSDPISTLSPLSRLFYDNNKDTTINVEVGHKCESTSDNNNNNNNTKQKETSMSDNNNDSKDNTVGAVPTKEEDIDNVRDRAAKLLIRANYSCAQTDTVVEN